MTRGDLFSLRGYDEIAHAMVAEGGGNPFHNDVVVVNNNSTHYLVAWRETCTSEDGHFVRSFRYDDLRGDESEAGRVNAYAAALALMLTLALSH